MERIILHRLVITNRIYGHHTTTDAQREDIMQKITRPRLKAHAAAAKIKSKLAAGYAPSPLGLDSSVPPLDLHWLEALVQEVVTDACDAAVMAAEVNHSVVSFTCEFHSMKVQSSVNRSRAVGD